MKKSKSKDRVKILLIILLAISLGYALLATTLKINGNSIITKQRWNVYWDNAVLTDGSKPMTAPTISQDENDMLKTKVSWTASFDEPGDYYEFTIDAVNAGSIDAKIAKFETKVTGDKTKLPRYLTLTVKYADGTTPEVNDILAKKSNDTPTKKKYRIRMEYDGDYATAEDINNMPAEGVTINVAYTITYSQGNLTYEDEPEINKLITRIEKNPDGYRNADQDPSNKDIGIDDNGNIINLDWWVASVNCPGTKIYFYDDNTNEITMGEENCGRLVENSIPEEIITMATSSEQMDNGKMTTPIPAYIYLADREETYPVTTLQYLFGHTTGYSSEYMTKMPDLPSTIKTIGVQTFACQQFEKIQIPEGVENIGHYAFLNNSYFTGSIRFPQTTKNIAYEAFYGCHITTASVPRAATVEEGAFESDTVIKYY